MAVRLVCHNAHPGSLCSGIHHLAALHMVRLTHCRCLASLDQHATSAVGVLHAAYLDVCMCTGGMHMIRQAVLHTVSACTACTRAAACQKHSAACRRAPHLGYVQQSQACLDATASAAGLSPQPSCHLLLSSPARTAGRWLQVRRGQRTTLLLMPSMLVHLGLHAR